MTLFGDKPELLVSFREGERGALAEVFHHYIDAVDAVIRNGCQAGPQARAPGIRDADEGRGLVHEVFQRAFSSKARRAFDGARPYRPYLLTIARNALIDHWRRRGRTDRWLVDEEAVQEADLATEEPATEEDLDFKARLEATRAFVAGLPRAQREFVRLRFEEERSQAELSAQLGLSRWRVRAMESAIRKGLRRALKKRGLLER